MPFDKATIDNLTNIQKAITAGGGLIVGVGAALGFALALLPFANGS
ncbi:Na+-translocating ferredoxin:NAD+ oxidoreductase RnfA subunit [Rhodococcus sp. LBL1]|nr:Na+-translocating ferredoxin:NAD+ oxidoreductase RnfA subunit [Rhodococcus sp. LBL1]MDH6684074.1 Na+-translocating ferredoxin:NAD+ oxidoreductase RnfA subunit [Rhodococcus sp. LBL2]